MTDQQKAPVFVRDATGLVRAFGWFDAFWIVSLGFGSSVLTGLAFYLAYYYVVGAGIYSSIIAIALTLPLSFLVYWPIMQMSIAMPRSGGDYIFVSRTIHPSIGFMNNFMFTVAALIGIGISIPYVISLALTAPLYVYGLQTGNTALSNIANAAGQPVTAFVLGTLLLLVIFGVMTSKIWIFRKKSEVQIYRF